MSINYKGSNMAMNSLAYIPGFCVKLFIPLIYTDYGN